MDDSSDGGKQRERERERWVAIGGHVCHSHFLLLFLLFSSDQEQLLPPPPPPPPHLSILLGVSVNSFLFLWHRAMHWRARSNDFAMLGMQRHYACASRTLLGTDEQPDPRYVPRRWPRDDRPRQLASRLLLADRTTVAMLIRLRPTTYLYRYICTRSLFLPSYRSFVVSSIDTCRSILLISIDPDLARFIYIYIYFSLSPIQIPSFSFEKNREERWKETRRQVGDNRQTRLTLRGAKRCRR